MNIFPRYTFMEVRRRGREREREVQYEGKEGGGRGGGLGERRLKGGEGERGTVLE